MEHPKDFAERIPDKPAFIMAGSGETVTYRQLDERSNQCAHLFRELGLQVRDHVAIFMENNPDYLVMTWAAQRSGLYYTCVGARLTADEVAYIVNDCEAKVLLTSKAMADVAESLTDLIPNVHTKLMVNGTIDGYESYEQRTGAHPITPIPDGAEGSDMLYSSGTTGRPKGVLPELTAQEIGEDDPRSMLLQLLFAVNEDSVYLSPAPLYHAAPLRFCMMMHRIGATVIIMEKFDEQSALALIEKYKVTHSQWVPTMFVRMLKLPEEERNKYDLSSHKMAVHAAAPCPVPVKEQMIEWWGPIFREYYAGTEGNCFITLSSEEWLEHKGSVGRPVIGVLRILDEDENVLPSGEAGGVYVEDGGGFEYHNDPEKTAASRSSKGWTTLGDIGYLDDEGYLYLVDRKADVIIIGGVNIYPQEAENVLVMHPKLTDAAVFGIPHEEYGEEVKAVVQPVNMSDAGLKLEAELIDFCRSKLARDKCPRTVDFLEELPRTPTGKMLKRLLKAPYWEGKKGLTG